MMLFCCISSLLPVSLSFCPLPPCLEELKPVCQSSWSRTKTHEGTALGPSHGNKNKNKYPSNTSIKCVSLATNVHQSKNICNFCRIKV